MTERVDRRFPLRWRLPLSFGAVLLVVVVGMAWIGWRGVRAAAFDTISERLDGAANRLDNFFEASTNAILMDVGRLAADSAVLRYVTTGRDEAAARRVLSAHDHAGMGRLVELWDRGGRLRLAAGSDSTASRGFPDWAVSGRPLTSFVLSDSLILFGAAAPVVVGGDTVGYAVEWRGAASGALATLIRDLIGSDARYLIGVPGETWTDLDTVNAGPEDSLVDGVTIETTVADRGERVGQARQLGATPWWVWVAFPRDYVYAHAEMFLRVMSVVAVLMVGLGALAGWRASGRITDPLGRLAAAADGIATGDYTRRAPANGDDELHRLAVSFNRMADEVEAGHHRLEERVGERTRELREAQETVVRSERLAILGQLSSGVGHELRNPLGVMNNAVYYLQATLKDQSPKVAEYLAILRQQIVLSERIVGDLLDFARIKPPQRQATRVSELIDAQVARAAIPGRVTVDRAVPPGLVAVIDPVQIGQVVLNLVINAVQAMEGPGRLTIRTDESGARLRVTVTDTGPGIAPKHLAKIFEPLFTTKARGIGLGLAVSRGLAEANGGRLGVLRTGPDGTTFVLDLPVPEGAA